MSNDLHRRREILLRHVGATLSIKREFRARAKFADARIVAVNRSRVVVNFPDEPLKVVTDFFGAKKQTPVEWTLPITWLLLPGSIEPDPRQLPLIAEALEQ